eukprot:Rmarinus@m.29898
MTDEVGPSRGSSADCHDSEPCNLTDYEGEYEDQLQQIAGDLKDLTKHWDQRIHALRHIQKVINTELSESDGDRLCTCLVGLITLQTTDLRSLVVKEACRTLSQLSGSLRIPFASHVSHVMPQLFRLRAVTIKVISDSGHKCMEAIIETTLPERCFSSVALGCVDAHPKIRAGCLECLGLLLRQSEFNPSEKDFMEVEQLFRASLSDSVEAVRAASRNAFSEYERRWSARAKDFLSSLDEGLAQSIRTGRRRPASSRSSIRELRRQHRKSGTNHTGLINGEVVVMTPESRRTVRQFGRPARPETAPIPHTSSQSDLWH